MSIQAKPADFLQHAADVLQYLHIFCNSCRFSATLCRFSARPADFLQDLQIFCNTLRIFCNTCGFSAIPTDFLQCTEHGGVGGGGSSGLKMQFFPVFYHKIGILLSKYFEEHTIIQKHICIIANHHFLSQ